MTNSPVRLGKDSRYLAGFTRWTSFAVRKPATDSWMSADARVEFMRFENVGDNPEPRDLKIRWFAANEQAFAVPFPRAAPVQRLPGASDREAAGWPAILRHAHGGRQSVLVSERGCGGDLEPASPVAPS